MSTLTAGPNYWKIPGALVKDTFNAPKAIGNVAGRLCNTFGKMSALDSLKYSFMPQSVYADSMPNTQAAPTQAPTQVPTSDPNQLVDWGNTPTGGGTGSGGTATQQNLQPLNGQLYDLNDPGQRQAYFNIANQLLQNNFSQANTQLENNTNQQKQNAYNSFTSQANALNDSTGALTGQLNKFNNHQDDYSKQLTDLYDGLIGGGVNRSNYFTRLSPDTYQSGQGSSADFANQKYQQ